MSFSTIFIFLVLSFSAEILSVRGYSASIDEFKALFKVDCHISHEFQECVNRVFSSKRITHTVNELESLLNIACDHRSSLNDCMKLSWECRSQVQSGIKNLLLQMHNDTLDYLCTLNITERSDIVEQIRECTIPIKYSLANCMSNQKSNEDFREIFRMCIYIEVNNMKNCIQNMKKEPLYEAWKPAFDYFFQTVNCKYCTASMSTVAASAAGPYFSIIYINLSLLLLLLIINFMYF